MFELDILRESLTNHNLQWESKGLQDFGVLVSVVFLSFSLWFSWWVLYHYTDRQQNEAF